ncbi:MAG TPA: hypothetical protein VJ521_01170, partial [Acidobacteriota bacterium]|nr:hypothetical protein [Acidobacteriota bacterium]
MWKIFGRGFDSRRLHQLTIILLVLSASGVPAQDDQLLIFEGEKKSQIPIVKLDGADYISAPSLQSPFGLTSSPIGTQSLSLSSDSHNIILSADRALVSVDEKLISLSRPVLALKGIWYLPIDFIPKVLKITAGQRFLWLPNSRSLILGDLQPNQLTLRYSSEKDYGRMVFQSVRAIGFTVVHENHLMMITPQGEDFVSKIPDTQFHDGVVQRLTVHSVGDRKIFQIQTGPDFVSYKSMELSDPPR